LCSLRIAGFCLPFSKKRYAACSTLSKKNYIFRRKLKMNENDMRKEQEKGEKYL